MKSFTLRSNRKEMNAHKSIVANDITNKNKLNFSKKT